MDDPVLTLVGTMTWVCPRCGYRNSHPVTSLGDGDDWPCQNVAVCGENLSNITIWLQWDVWHKGLLDTPLEKPQ